MKNKTVYPIAMKSHDRGPLFNLVAEAQNLPVTLIQSDLRAPESAVSEIFDAKNSLSIIQPHKEKQQQNTQDVARDRPNPLKQKQQQHAAATPSAGANEKEGRYQKWKGIWGKRSAELIEES